jgi:ligand-binding sensor domain-containing protein
LVIGQDGRLFIGTGLGIFTSSDEGEHWATVSEAMPDTNVQSLVLDSGGNLYVGTGTGILKKARGSNAWQVLDRGIVFPTVRALTFDPDRGIFAGTYGSGIYRSRDAGNIWEPMSEGLSNADVRILVQDSQRTLYAGTDRGVYVANRKIRQWVHLGEGMGPLEVKALVMTQEDTLYAGTPRGLYRRSSGEGSWKTVDLPFSDLHSSVKDSRSGTIQSIVIGQRSELYAATEDQLFSQSEKDKAWQSILMEPTPGKIRGIAVHETIYVWTETAVLRGERSRGEPFRWKNINETMPTGLIIYTVIVEPGRQGSVMYAGTNRGIFWTRDEGRHWQSAQGSHAAHPVEVIFTPAEGVLLLGSQEQGVLFAVNRSRKGIFDRIMGQ